MTPLNTISSETLAGIAADVAALLQTAQKEILSHQPKCDASGNCCNFEKYGHRLYVSMAELIHFAHVIAQQKRIAAQWCACDQPQNSEKRISLPQFFADAQHSGCPYQIDHLCCAREARPLGCRVYYCDPDAQSWQNDIYEKYHIQLKTIHDKWGIDYAYLEWRHGLKILLSADMLPDL